MSKSKAFKAAGEWSKDEERLFALKLVGIEEDWFWRWAAACSAFKGGSEFDAPINRLIGEKCTRFFKLLSTVGSKNPCWGEPKFTRKVVEKYIRQLQANFDNDFDKVFPNCPDYKFLLASSKRAANEAGERVIRKAEIEWREKEIASLQNGKFTRVEHPEKSVGSSIYSLGGRSSPDIVKRRTIVFQNVGREAKGPCELFDNARIPLPKTAKEAGSWAKAYLSPSLRHSVESLISKDRKHAKKLS